MVWSMVCDMDGKISHRMIYHLIVTLYYMYSGCSSSTPDNDAMRVALIHVNKGERGASHCILMDIYVIMV